MRVPLALALLLCLETTAVSAQAPQNLNACLRGLSTCDQSLLTAEERARTSDSARSRNVNACMQGPASNCDQSLLTAEERERSADAARTWNVNACVHGPARNCDQSALNDGERARVDEAAARRRRQ